MVGNPDSTAFLRITSGLAFTRPEPRKCIPKILNDRIGDFVLIKSHLTKAQNRYDFRSRSPSWQRRTVSAFLALSPLRLSAKASKSASSWRGDWKHAL
jgi:hypothetical protein